MTPIAWVVEHSLQASERFRHLTVLPTLQQTVNNMTYEDSVDLGIPVRMLLGYGRTRSDQG